MEPPVRLEHSPGEALSSSAALSDVAAAVERDGIVVLRREKGLRPDELVDFMQRLSRATGGDGDLMEVISDIRHACAATEPSNVALILSNIRLGTAAAEAICASGEGYVGQDPDGAPEGFNTVRGGGAQLGRDEMKNYLGSPPGRAAVWHQDEQYRHLPAHLTLLYCVHTPPDALGDTTFCDTVLGYEALPAELADRISGLTASHSLANIPLMNGDDPTTRPDHSVATHPMVLAMPNSRRAVYIGSLGADVHGLEGADGPELLRSLLDHTQQCGSYTHAWVPGDVVVMDNRRIMHSASGKDYPDHDRLLVRVQSVASDEMMRPITGGGATGAKL